METFQSNDLSSYIVDHSKKGHINGNALVIPNTQIPFDTDERQEHLLSPIDQCVLTKNLTSTEKKIGRPILGSGFSRSKNPSNESHNKNKPPHKTENVYRPKKDNRPPKMWGHDDRFDKDYD